ncbi:MAG TPA: hypothetical protein VGS07_34075 [Thermoanaerobaculia bacterium]|nr:hypothetical protein [Thermoanaerobaculia bacterium]
MATHDIERISAVKKGAEGRLLAIPGVHAVGLGAKYAGGQRTREPAIMVFVEKKKPAGDLLPHEVIPSEIDGVKTDVMESAPPRLHSDDKKYRPLVGGVQIWGGGTVGGGGTLGCIARIEGPIPRIVGITNRHVVGDPKQAWVTELAMLIDPKPNVNAIVVGGKNTAGTLIIVDLTRNQSKDRALYVTRAEDTLADIAKGLADAITSIGDGYSASAVGERVTLTEAAGAQFAHGARVFGPHRYRETADLRATIVGTEITLTGKASQNCGLFINWNVGGVLAPTRGVFTRVRKGSELAEVAGWIAAAITSLKLPGINATATGSKVLVLGVQQIECDVSSDIRYGQPQDCFCSACCACCNDLIGVVTDARLELDVALIELKAGLEYRAEIEEIGIIKGTRSYGLADLLAPQPILLRKRGIKTGLTLGTLLAIDEVGENISIGEQGTPQEWQLYHRYYSNAMRVKSVNKLPFSDHGDSGSAVVNEANEVIGILFGGGDTQTSVTPVAQIEAAFDLSVVTAEAKGQVNTVPVLQGHAFAAIETEPVFIGRLREVEHELTATPAGREIAEVGRRHAGEVVRLVNHNRRVGTVWRRNGGPELVQTALTMAQSGERQVPRQINGRPLAECLRRMQEILTRYGSVQLAADLRRYGPRIIDLTKFEYPQLLAALGAAPQ